MTHEKKQEPPDRLITVPQIAKLAKRDLRRVYYWTSKGILPAPKRCEPRAGGGRPTNYYSEREVKAFLAKLDVDIPEGYVRIGEVPDILDLHIWTVRHFMKDRPDFPKPLIVPVLGQRGDVYKGKNGDADTEALIMFNKEELIAWKSTYVPREKWRGAKKKPTNGDQKAVTTSMLFLAGALTPGGARKTPENASDKKPAKTTRVRCGV